MSSDPIPVTAATAPFVQTTTLAIDRANRLISLRANPGFLDLMRISQDLIQSAVDTCSDYPGWDPQVMVVLKVRMQAAKEHHQLLFSKIQDAISDGVEESRAQVASMSAKTAAEAVDQGDYVRQKVLETFDQYDSRPAGSF
jgi:hypothetical protein